MSKSRSGHCNGTSGVRNSIENSTPPLFYNGHVTYEGIAAHREEFMNKTVDQIADMLHQNGYEFIIHGSRNPNSTAVILEITNSSRDRNIKQVQVSSNGSNRHGGIPYVKISTSNEGKIKVIDGTSENYRTDGTERARLIFRRN